MPVWDRRKFLSLSATASVPLFTDLGFLAPLSQLTAAEPSFDPAVLDGSDDLLKLVNMIRETPREKCVPVFVAQLRDGLSYQQFLAALFLASLSHGDPHQVAQVYSAQRVGDEVRMEERLLPLFWVLDRLALGFEQEPDRTFKSIDAGNNWSLGTEDSLRDAQERLDPTRAEQAAILLSRARGPRTAMIVLWEFCSRRAGGTLGHNPIVLANAWRTLEAIGWRHAEPVLQYLAGGFAANESDASYEPNRQLVAKCVAKLPAGWTQGEADQGATRELYAVLRQGNHQPVCEFICSQLQAGKLNAMEVWDAIHLTAADLLVRYKNGGNLIGGVLVHAVTATDALRFGFNCTGLDRARLLMMLQAVAMLDGTFIAPAKRDNQLRNLNLLDLSTDPSDTTVDVAAVFQLLPMKDFLYEQKSVDERTGSDQACSAAFALMQKGENVRLFLQTARRLMCVKASVDPHDMKYPAAAFDDAFMASSTWLPYLLASTVHALHGPRSADSASLIQAREALG